MWAFQCSFADDARALRAGGRARRERGQEEQKEGSVGQRRQACRCSHASLTAMISSRVAFSSMPRIILASSIELPVREYRPSGKLPKTTPVRHRSVYTQR